MSKRFTRVIAVIALLFLLYPGSARAGEAVALTGLAGSAASAGSACTTREEILQKFAEGLAGTDKTLAITFTMPTSESVEEYALDAIEAEFFPYADACRGWGIVSWLGTYYEGDAVKSETITFSDMVTARKNAKHNARFPEQIEKLCEGISGSPKAKLKTLSKRLADKIDYKRSQGCASRALKKGKGNCHAFSYAFYYACEYLGIECEYVTGHVPGGYHAWNRVTIDGKQYWYDITGYNAGGTKYLASKKLWSGYSVTSVK